MGESSSTPPSADSAATSNPPRPPSPKVSSAKSYHIRAAWTRTRGVPVGTGWFTQKEKSGGGAIIDVGLAMLDLAWFLLGQPNPQSAFGITHRKLANTEVEDAGFAIVRFEGGKSIELAASWALNQSPAQNGTACRIHGPAGAIEVYTPNGAVLFRDFNEKGDCKENPLKPPKLTHHAALMRHFKDCIAGRATPSIGGDEALTLMRMIEGIYRSSEKAKSMQL
jgi:predicted dehydrogenase